jgi:purine-nucleoside/S-methyl-5'-thioadenosine phosphorylase / adenosine deaminase
MRSGADIQVVEPDWPTPPGVRVAFTLRTGGVSIAPYDSLNLGAGVGDSHEAVAENRRRVRERLQLPAEPVWLEQVHGVDVVDISDVTASHGASSLANTSTDGAPASTDGTPPRADASVAHAPGQVCAIRVADCMPVVFAAVDGSAVGAAHAGWRGLAGGVLEATVARLRVPASKLVAWMGPAIGVQHFEVGDDVRTAFMAKDVRADLAFVKNERDRWQCDLYLLARRRLSALGVEAVYGGGWCTFAEADRFFSYRRDGRCGRMAALVWIEPGRH